MTAPRYKRLADQLGTAIQDGKLTPGERLPTHRAFAQKFGVALATATRVYAELERRGLVVGEAGRGTFVRDPGVPMTLGLRQTAQEDLVDLVFNMPSGAADARMLRAGMRRMAGAGELEALLRYQPHGGRPHEREVMARHLSATLRGSSECIVGGRVNGSFEPLLPKCCKLNQRPLLRRQNARAY